ncbi:MAG: DUF885 domain-containing protein [Betaproteobacteria bacterium]|nr:MAG: DUF885 domain-containing protein [Betaproteobacteria bacterium]
MRSRKLCFLSFTLASGIFCVLLSASAAEPPWITASDRNSAIVIEMQGAFHPEFASELGVDRFDAAVLDLNPENAKRYDAAAGRVLELLAAKRKAESDPKVRQDLDILIEAVESRRRTSALEHRLLIPYFDLPRHIFEGLKVLLDARNRESRQRSALQRLRRYAGIEPGTVPLAELARARASERFATPKLVWPYEGQVRQNLDNSERYIAGIAELFRSSGLRDWETAHARLAAQLRNHSEWVRTVVLPRARKEHTLPRELYADRLKTTGVDLEPEQAISMGAFAFTEIRDEAARLAARIARERNLASADYRDVIRELKRSPVPPDRILVLYRDRLKAIEEIVARERIISLPQRAASIRLASEAESAAIAAPFMNPPRLVGNRGEVGEFVLPLTNPNAKSSDPVDDFTAEAAAWTLTAHEARPGHELQFAAMVEGGVSLARAAFAFNSTNAEGWGLYAESLMIPYFPLEGQLFSLQLRLLRAARAFLDPMVNLGRMNPDEAKAFLMREVALSEPFAQQEADRYAFRMPGQAVSYFYGYTRLRELRLKAELALGPRFEQRRFHDLVIAQGLLPPRLLEQAVMQEIERMR